MRYSGKRQDRSAPNVFTGFRRKRLSQPALKSICTRPSRVEVARMKEN